MQLTSLPEHKLRRYNVADAILGMGFTWYQSDECKEVHTIQCHLSLFVYVLEPQMAGMSMGMGMTASPLMMNPAQMGSRAPSPNMSSMMAGQPVSSSTLSMVFACQAVFLDT